MLKKIDVSQGHIAQSSICCDRSKIIFNRFFIPKLVYKGKSNQFATLLIFGLFFIQGTDGQEWMSKLSLKIAPIAQRSGQDIAIAVKLGWARFVQVKLAQINSEIIKKNERKSHYYPPPSSDSPLKPLFFPNHSVHTGGGSTNSITI